MPWRCSDHTWDYTVRIIIHVWSLGELQPALQHVHIRLDYDHALSGKTYDYRISYKNIERLLLLKANQDGKWFFIISLVGLLFMAMQTCRVFLETWSCSFLSYLKSFVATCFRIPNDFTLTIDWFMRLCRSGRFDRASNNTNISWWPSMTENMCSTCRYSHIHAGLIVHGTFCWWWFIMLRQCES